ncbi:amino acid adenylation domain-containing protein [Mycobacterium sp. 94-17]|uniref:amino acid adenylation domain-containing protein n=1 Tax=Mycobacterium sp. 94-17 TaxID=2986147 RepID=UPI002D1E796F|nr:amino acid adenylation domain-containing protein [Mycobacterium sp. 94-17]MEB4210069.1 amino acid adenylation domain-containing protein [Mycobacterium sp. 94-17]
MHLREGVTDGGVLAAVLDHADRAPDRPAVVDLDRALTRGELRVAAGRVAAGLRAGGVGPGERVALLIGNSVDFVVAALGCLWAGVTFVPLAIGDPELRRAQILADCRPAQVITADAGQAAPSGLPVDTAWTPLAALSAAGGPTPPPVTGPISYIIYTSGTTGRPKGVQIPPDAFFTAVQACADAVGLSPDDRALCVSPVHFDGSFSAIFPPLVRGVPLVIPDREALLFPRRFFSIVEGEGITVTSFSPSYLRLLRSSGRMARLADTPLRVIALGGEAPSTADIRAVWAASPRLRVVNRYGPTETTIAVAHLELSPELLDAGPVPIGHPHPGSSFYLVDEHGELVDRPGVIGEMYVGGPQLMAGYLNAPAVTAAALRTDVIEGTTLYRTGDLVFRDERGHYVYAGRSDRVIKRHGVRMSLVEVTEALDGIDEVAAAACTTFDRDGDLGVVAFVVPRGELTPLAVRQAAGSRLPETMLPDQFVLVADLPLTSSSKVDERRLLHEAGLFPPNREA